MIVIIDYKVGNVGSIKNMLIKIGYDCIISGEKKDIEGATKLILPGVGSFDNGIKNLKNLNLFDLINKKVLNDKSYVLIDNRTQEEFLGSTPYGSPRGGHIPNAIHIHWPDFFKRDGMLKTANELSRLLEKEGVLYGKEIVVYCTGGVRSAMAYFVFRYLGFRVRNYDGSWWDWSQDFKLPIEISG